MANISFSIDFEGLTIRQTTTYLGKTITNASLHRLTPEQFDALVEAFGSGEVQTLTTSGESVPAVTFRTTDIVIGGMNTTIFANVSETDVAQVGV